MFFSYVVLFLSHSIDDLNKHEILTSPLVVEFMGKKQLLAIQNLFVQNADVKHSK